MYDEGRRAGRRAAVDRRDAPALALGRPLRPEPERRHGLDAGRGRPRPVPDPEHAGRASRARRHADRAGLSHGPLGDRPAGPGGGRGAEAARASSRSPAMVSDPCDGRTQGTAGMMDSLPYRNDAAIVFRRLDPLAPAPQGGARRRDLRQGAARDDAGPGRGRRTCRACSSPAA